MQHQDSLFRLLYQARPHVTESLPACLATPCRILKIIALEWSDPTLIWPFHLADESDAIAVHDIPYHILNVA